MPKINYLNVFYAPASNCFECFPLEGASYRIDLVVDDKGEILASSKRRDTYVTAEQLAEDVVEELVESVGG